MTEPAQSQYMRAQREDLLNGSIFYMALTTLKNLQTGRNGRAMGEPLPSLVFFCCFFLRGQAAHLADSGSRSGPTLCTCKHSRSHALTQSVRILKALKCYAVCCKSLKHPDAQRGFRLHAGRVLAGELAHRGGERRF